GHIYDRYGEELAGSIESASVYVHPTFVRSKSRTAFQISKILNIKHNEVLKKISQKKTFVWIARQIPEEIGNKIRKLKLPGVGVIAEPKRYYPQGTLAAQLLGFVGTDGQGLEGIELAFDAHLRGEKFVFHGLADALGTPMLDPYRSSLRRSGSSLVLTLDKSLQYLAEREIEQTVEEFVAQRGLIIIMNPHLGEIVALAQFPSFNPNFFYKSAPFAWKNVALTDVFEPGSTFKTFLVAQAIESRLMKETDKFFCENGKLKVANKVIGEASGHQYGLLSVADILKYSSNIGAAKIAMKLGKEKYYNSILQFGFGEKTGIQFPSETSGIVRPPKLWSQVDLTTAAFGQGVSVSPLQLITAFSALANGGYLMKPYVVKEIVNREGEKLEETQPIRKRQVLSAQTLQTLNKMLIRVTEEGGTASNIRVPYFSIAGKTGTAQKPSTDGRGYSGKYISSFLGYFPAEQPQYSMLVMIDEPLKHYYASTVAVPAFKRLTQEIVRLYAKDFQEFVLNEQTTRMKWPPSIP
ncbi:MAG: penicillin-binding protein 2, partial [Deltaproteobacteria bacterium]|nr:penicillin-binding protein 2 [Deltaproteobacteria bacterium]